MEQNSNTFIYIVAGIILLHFIAGFAFLIYKMTKKEQNK
jgi:hypothetical protein